MSLKQKPFTYLFKRLILTVPVIFGVCSLTFLLIHFVPGDPIDILLGDQVNEFDRMALQKRLGLDLPLYQQFLNFWWNLFHLNLGTGLYNATSVSEIIAQRIPATFELTFTALTTAVIIGIPLGVFAATQKYNLFDNILMGLSLLGVALPGFFLAPLLIWVFAIQLGWLPVSERGTLAQLVLPSLSLAIPLSAYLLRMTRTQVLEELHKDYITVARAKGLSLTAIYFKHALRNALITITTLIGLQVGALLTGTVITETIFDWPGLGTLLVQSIQQRDYPVLQGSVLVIAIIYVVVNLLTDLIYTKVDPRVSLDAST